MQLAVEDKLKICTLAKQNVSKSELMDDFKIGKSTLNDILRNEENFKQLKVELGIPGAAKTTKIKVEFKKASWLALCLFGFISSAKRAVG